MFRQSLGQISFVCFFLQYHRPENETRLPKFILSVSKVCSFCDNAIIECHQCNFSEKFGVASVMKIYTKIRELWMHLDYDHSHVSLTSKYGKFQPQSIFHGNNPFYINPIVARVKISEKKKHEYFRFEISLTFSKWIK